MVSLGGVVFVDLVVVMVSVAPVVVWVLCEVQLAVSMQRVRKSSGRMACLRYCERKLVFRRLCQAVA